VQQQESCGREMIRKNFWLLYRFRVALSHEQSATFMFRQKQFDVIQYLYSMEIDYEKIDNVVLALLYLTSFKEHDVIRAWKGHDWDVLDRLYDKGMIHDPKNRNRSVILTEEGAKLSEAFFKRLFEKSE
jgi:hypothetical protein